MTVILVDKEQLKAALISLHCYPIFAKDVHERDVIIIEKMSGPVVTQRISILYKEMK